MKILLHGYNTCCQNQAGGVQTRIRKIYALLKQRNLEVDYFSSFEIDLRNYEVLHVFRLDYETRGLIRCAKRLGLRVVLSSIVSISGGRKLKLLKILNKFGIPTLYKYSLEILGMVDVVIVESYKESEYIQKYFGIAQDKIKIVPNGIDIPNSAGEEIYQQIGKKDYVLQIGRFDANKNQLNVIRAVKDTNINVVFIGGADETESSNYFEKCKLEAEGCDNITFLGWLTHNNPLFSSALQHAKALILPSYFETFGLVALEGAIYGAEVCLSTTLPLNDFNVFDARLTFSPSSIGEIKNVLQDVIIRPRNQVLKKKVQSYFSWDRIIDIHIDIYKGKC